MVMESESFLANNASDDDMLQIPQNPSNATPLSDLTNDATNSIQGFVVDESVVSIPSRTAASQRSHAAGRHKFVVPAA